MKHLITILALMAISASSTFAAPSTKISQSKITSMNFSKGLFLQKFKGGTIEVDKKNQVARLILMPQAVRCPNGAMCAQMIVGPTVVSLPLVATEKDGCGSVHYIAKENLLTVDGGDSSLEITDNSKNNCKTFAMLIPTTVKYSTKYLNRTTGELIEGEGQISGDSMKTITIKAMN